MFVKGYGKVQAVGRLFERNSTGMTGLLLYSGFITCMEKWGGKIRKIERIH